MAAGACDSCKSRKVKCDGPRSEGSCSNCRMSDLTCQYLRKSKKRGPKPMESRQSAQRHRNVLRTSEALSGNNDRPLVQSLEPQSVSSVSYSPGIIDNTPGQGSVTPLPEPVHPSVDDPIADLNHRIFAIHQTLIDNLAAAVPTLSLEQLVSKCVDLYIDDFLPISPFIHEPTLRSNIMTQPPLLLVQSANFQARSPSSNPCIDSEQLTTLRSYVLISAICGLSVFRLPPELFVNSALGESSFLQASRDTLKLYQDLDIEIPDSSSLVIRIFHAGVLHTCGKVLSAAHSLGEAIRLAQGMRLFEESSYIGLNPIEARLRRSAFWQLRIMDAYIAIFEGNPMTLQDFFLDADLGTRYQDESAVYLDESIRSDYIRDKERGILKGFCISQQLWSTACEVILDLQTLSRLCRSTDAPDTIAEAKKMKLGSTYLTFLGVLDEHARFLQTPEAVNSSDEAVADIAGTRHYWIQRANILTTYHSLKMVLLQRFADLGLVGLLGLNSESDTLALRQTEIAHDLVCAITSLPLYSLLVNGEACVMKVRRVGATLLQLMQHSGNPQIVSRARLLLQPLLDILAKLDSRVLNELSNEYLLPNLPIQA